MGCRAQPVRYPISRTVQQMTRETRMGQPSYTEFRILPNTVVLPLSPPPTKQFMPRLGFQENFFIDLKLSILRKTIFGTIQAPRINVPLQLNRERKGT